MSFEMFLHLLKIFYILPKKGIKIKKKNHEVTCSLIFKKTQKLFKK
jgi:hypothetical protein